jgi:hypothetical protein
VKSTLVFCIIVTLSPGLTLVEPTQATAASGPAEAPQVAAPDDLLLPVYTPPKKLSPRARVGARDGGSDPEIKPRPIMSATIQQTPAPIGSFKPAYSVRSRCR